MEVGIRQILLTVFAKLLVAKLTIIDASLRAKSRMLTEVSSKYQLRE